VRRRSVAAAIALGACALGGGAWYYAQRMDGHPIELPQGRSLEVAQLEELRPLPGAALQTDQGSLAAAQMRGRWSFVYFGYTNCPDACPTTLGILNHVQDALKGQGLEPPRILLVSVDPQRDTPQVLARYAAEFGKDTLGATGEDAALRTWMDFFGVAIERKPTADPKVYTFDHTTEIFLVTPDLRWLATFAPAEDPESIVQDTGVLMRLSLP
jgi:protein SCO1